MNLIVPSAVLLTVIAGTLVDGDQKCKIPKEYKDAWKEKDDYRDSSSSDDSDSDDSKNKYGKRSPSSRNSCQCGKIARIVVIRKDGSTFIDKTRCPVCPNGQPPKEDPKFCDGNNSKACKAKNSNHPCVQKVTFFTCCESVTPGTTSTSAAKTTTSSSKTTPSTTTVPPPE